jgi:UDP-glucose 4-epimerase
MSKILCVGGAGFVGSNVANELSKQGHDVIIIDDLSAGSEDNLKYNQKLFIKDIFEESCRGIFDHYKFDFVFHLAAKVNLRESIRNPVWIMESNVLGSLKIIQYCCEFKVKRLIFSSTGGAIYSPDAPIPWQENSILDPQSPYGLSKLWIEQYLKMANKLYGLDYSILRYGNVYGPHQDPQGEAGVVSIFLDALLEGRDLKMFGSGEQRRDFIYVDDVVQANILMMNEVENEIYNVGSNSSISVNEVAKELTDQLDIIPAWQYLPEIKGEVFETKLSYNKIKQNCGWEPKVSFKEGIKKTTEWRKS